MVSGDRRIIVEVATPELVRRLESELSELRQDLKQLQQRHEALHKTVYQLMEVLSELRRKGLS